MTGTTPDPRDEQSPDRRRGGRHVARGRPTTGGRGSAREAARASARGAPEGRGSGTDAADIGRGRDGRRGRDADPRGPTRRPPTNRPAQPDAARQVALEVLAAVRSRGAYANLTLPGLLTERGVRGRDAAFATELAYGACRALGQLDAVIDAAGDRQIPDLDAEVVDALRLGSYQLLHTRVPPHAAVSATVELVRTGARPGAAGYVNAVLRRIAQADLATWVDRLAPPMHVDAYAYLAMAHAHPRWIVHAFDAALRGTHDGSDPTGEPHPELADALAADDIPPTVHLLARPGLIGQDELVAGTRARPARFSPYGVYLPGGDPGRIPAIADGRAAVQDEGSQLVALALLAADLDGSDGRWLDLAAGPGGKTGLLGALAAQRGATVDAVEPARHRAELVRRTTRGLPVRVHTVDGRASGLAPESFDRVLLDAPCTGLGALRRRPEARWRRQPADVPELVTLQGELLAAATALVRRGGVVAYVTCSPHPAETHGVVDDRPDELRLLPAAPLLPAGMPDLGPGPTVQLWPHRHGTDGMFLAVMRRR